MDTSLQLIHKVLLVDDDDAVRDMMTRTLESKGLGVVAAASVTEALRLTTTESFDVLITDLHMPSAGDGFSVVAAMRHSQLNALPLLVSGYPDVQSTMAAILLGADEVMLKPFEMARLPELIRQKMLVRRPAVPLLKESVGAILQRCIPAIVRGWLERVRNSGLINHLLLRDEERTQHLPRLAED